MKNKVFNLEDRLIEFVISINEVVEQLPNTKLGNHIGGQLIRCGTSPALNYGEAQSAESQKDFIHKMLIILKELKETRICLKIILKKPLLEKEKILSVLKENEELVAIFAQSIKTAKSNL
ncbi:MAG: four helix bundle protein [Mariniphaga sp.]|nr:four helix bundle protein [Mariniphaga sp.]